MNQLRVIHAVMLRETRTRFGRHQMGYLWALVEPVLLIGMFYMLYTFAGREVPNGMSVVPFLATGILTYHLFAKTAERGSGAVGANKALLFYPHVKPLDLIFARTSLEAITYSLVFFLIVGVHALITQTWGIDSALRTIGALGLTSVMGITFGLLLSALGVVWQTVDRIRGPLIMRPLFWTSGLFYTANELPTKVRQVLLYNPLFHCTELARDAWFPGYDAHYASTVYVTLWIIGFAFVGLNIERGVRTKVHMA
jgi:capsular polysaccharide transport system permease protein